MDMTAISVVVARMIPNRVRKLRCLLDCSESAATAAASRKDAVWAIVLSDEIGRDFVPYLAHPLQEYLIQPKARRRFRYEADVTAMLDREQPQVRIPREGGVIVNLKRDQGVVFGLHQQRGYPNAIQELIGRLGGVIVVSGSESEGRRGKFIVELVDAFDSIQMLE